MIRKQHRIWVNNHKDDSWLIQGPIPRDIWNIRGPIQGSPLGDPGMGSRGGHIQKVNPYGLADNKL